MTLAERDRKVVWHPYTQMKNALPAIGITHAAGPYLYAEHGKRYIDAVSSWWVNIHGHSHPYIAEKVSAQLKSLEHVIFAGFTHEPAVELAERLLPLLPGQQDKVFYSDNGSTAVEVALKMCIQFWGNAGKPRRKILAFRNAYHGDTFGAMSVSGRSIFTDAFAPYLFDVEFIDLPTADNIAALKAHITSLGEELACFIFEPLVLGSGGMLMYQAALLDELLECCRQQEVLLIADEVMTGFGRTGRSFATGYLDQAPDIFCLSKGLTGGTMPLGITTCTDRIYEAFFSDDKLKTLYHGHSFTANPIACTAALASLDLFVEPETQLNLYRISRQHAAFAAKLSGHTRLRDIRQTGTILALEWETGLDTSYLSGLRDRLYTWFLERGILMRPLGNIIYLMPPYIIADEDLAYIYTQIEQALAEI
ncbi:adenosylmethionine--8-amino-7-oxononanoate transaminase [Pedobacter yulinensis]|uniref:Adenosylmethionine-8-amino-7-oxononanoate aminotransferase n=1 Tax=Pedobacter yulinensis TaxID=2126353 RepID=A0A2T3HLL5_9SPHI|nr:adenosylmethionine--8-amino-7-oxononanoate transaminase [Pedobacter yulinensis]PST83324.1 adenosylmethionine--8-amino-7-oxononanoate transaminase [Pedobacter yulinensis]